MPIVEPDLYVRLRVGGLSRQIGPYPVRTLLSRGKRREIQGTVTHYWHRPLPKWVPFDPKKGLPQEVNVSFERPFYVTGPYRTERRVTPIRAVFADGAERTGWGTNDKEALALARTSALNALMAEVVELRADGVEQLSVTLAAGRAEKGSTIFATASGTAVRLGPPVFEEEPDQQGMYR